MSSKKVTLQDIANAAGVSTATVSLVLNDNPRISETTRERVLLTVKELGYIYNRRAAALRTNHSYIVGLIINDLANPFYAEFTAAIEDFLTDHSYSLLMATSSDVRATQARQITTMLERGADGLILVPAVGTQADEIEALQKHLPLVLVNRHLSMSPVNYVGIDNEIGARRAVEYFITNGHTRIAFVGGHHNSSARRDRVQGYLGMLGQRNIPVDDQLNITSPVSRLGGYEAVQQMLAVNNPPTAALCYNDLVAYGVMLGLRACGLEPGKDFAVIGFDDVAESSLWSPPLASIEGWSVQIGRESARILLSQINNPDLPPEQIIMPSKLILRDSARVDG